MTYLLDTHTLLWLLDTPEVLPARVRGIIANRSVTLLISMVTPWEIAIKACLGKLEVGDLLDDFEATVKRGSYSILETSVTQVIRGGRLPLHHRDPFDRLLAAQALDLRIPLLSRDHVFDRYGVERIWD